MATGTHGGRHDQPEAPRGSPGPVGSIPPQAPLSLAQRPSAPDRPRSLSPAPGSALERIVRVAQAAALVASPEVAAARQERLDELMYGFSAVDAEGNRVDPRELIPAARELPAIDLPGGPAAVNL